MKSLHWILSLTTHTAVLVFGAAPQDIAYGVATGLNSVEINLVAAAPSEPIEQVPDATPDTIIPDVPEPEPDIVVPITPPKPVVSETRPLPAPEVAKPTRHIAKERGDGSSSQQGKDATTAQTQSGAIVNVKPDYLHNPPPVYPEEARRQREQGLVVLNVIVGTDGHTESVEITSGSGNSLLDRAAVNAVRKWKFRPATVAGMKIKSRAQVPIRFRLDS